jgi:uncharacterized Tic20 family protein
MEQQQEKTMAMLCHLTALAGFFIPFGNIVGPLIVWLVKKDESAVVDANGKKALNFQISITIYAMVAAALIFVGIGLLLLPAIGVFSLVMIIINSVKANKGEEVSYPLTIPIIK